MYPCFDCLIVMYDALTIVKVSTVIPFFVTTAVNGQPMGTYEQTMAVIAGSPRPVSITFLDPVNTPGFAGRSAMSGVGGGPPVQKQSWVRGIRFYNGVFCFLD